MITKSGNYVDVTRAVIIVGLALVIGSLSTIVLLTMIVEKSAPTVALATATGFATAIGGMALGFMTSAVTAPPAGTIHVEHADYINSVPPPPKVPET